MTGRPHMPVPDAVIVSAAATVVKAAASLRDRAVVTDDLRARRTFREWFNWSEDRFQSEPIVVALILGSVLDRLAPGLREDYKLDTAGAVDLEGVETLRDGRLVSEQWGVPGLCLRVVDLGKGGDLRMLGLLRRDVAVVAVEQGLELDPAALNLLKAAPLGLVEVNFDRSADGELRPSAEPGEPLHRLTMKPSASLQDLGRRLVARELERPVRLAIAARELGELSRALAVETTETAGIETASANEAIRIARADQISLDREARVTAAAAAEVNAALKDVIDHVKAAKAEVGATRLLVTGRSASFDKLLRMVEPSSERLPAEVFEFYPRREWWKDTPFQVMSFLWNKKDEIRLKVAALDNALEGDRIEATEHLREMVRAHGAAFEAKLESARKSFPCVSGPLSNDQPGAAATSPEALSMAAVQGTVKAFSEFAAAEARAIRIDRDHKGLLGMLGEARSAIFALFFVGAFFLRAPWVKEQLLRVLAWLDIEPNEKLPGRIMGIMIALVVVAFIVNFLNVHRRDRATVAERIDDKIEEMGVKLISVAERLAKDQLGLLEAKLADRAASIEREFSRRLEELKAQKEAQKGALAGTESRALEYRVPDLGLPSASERATMTEREELAKAYQALRSALLAAYRTEGAA